MSEKLFIYPKSLSAYTPLSKATKDKYKCGGVFFKRKKGLSQKNLKKNETEYGRIRCSALQMR